MSIYIILIYVDSVLYWHVLTVYYIDICWQCIILIYVDSVLYWYMLTVYYIDMCWQCIDMCWQCVILTCVDSVLYWHMLTVWHHRRRLINSTDTLISLAGVYHIRDVNSLRYGVITLWDSVTWENNSALLNLFTFTFIYSVIILFEFPNEA